MVELVRGLPLFRLDIYHLVYYGFFISFMKKYIMAWRPSFLFIHKIAVTPIDPKTIYGTTFHRHPCFSVKNFQFLFPADSNFYGHHNFVLKPKNPHTFPIYTLFKTKSEYFASDVKYLNRGRSVFYVRAGDSPAKTSIDNVGYAK